MILKTFENLQVRIIDIEGEPWFIARDVCQVLKNTDVPKAVERLHESEKLIRTLFVSGQNRAVNLINESGLYHLIFTSRLPEAERFRLWVTSEVLPEIRKTGSYQVPTDPTELVLMAADRLRKERDARILAEKELAEAKPAIDFHRDFVEADKTYTIAEAAKKLASKGVKTGQNRLFETLRVQGILNDYNIPKQRYIESGYFVLRTTIKAKGTPHQDAYEQTRLTTRGFDWLAKQEWL